MMLSAQALPSPRGRRFGGHLFDFNRDPLGFLARCARQYGDFVPLRFGPFPVMLVSSPQAIEEILVTKNRQFVKGRGLERLRRALGNGLLTSEGDFWRRQRRLIQPAFHHQRISAYGKLMSDFTERLLSGWQDGETRDIHKDMMALTMVIVAKSLFDADLSDEADDVRVAIEAEMDAFNQRSVDLVIPDWVPTPARVRARRANERLDEIVLGMIAARRHEGRDHGDLLSMLLTVRDDQGGQMTDAQLRDEVMTLFLAGHETTANTLSWGWMLLSRNPDVEARLHEELGTVLQGRPPSVEDLPNLPYTQRIVQETLRLYPPAWILTRQPVEPVQVAGVELNPEVGILMSQWVVHRDPRFYPQVERFWPDRWLPENSAGRPDFAYFPFGGGPRLCIGKPFALQEAALVLATIAQRYRLRLIDDRPIPMEPSVTLRPARGIRMRVERIKAEG